MSGPAPEAREAAKQFFEAWQARDWHLMSKHTQLTWALANLPAAARLKELFGGQALERFQIGAVGQVSGLKESVVDVFVGMKLRPTTVAEDEKLKWIYRRWRVISERQAFKAEIHEEARWGVNPVSIRPTTKSLAHL